MPRDRPMEARARMIPRTMRNGGKKTWRRKEKAAAVVNILSVEDFTFETIGSDFQLGS